MPRFFDLDMEENDVKMDSAQERVPPSYEDVVMSASERNIESMKMADEGFLHYGITKPSSFISGQEGFSIRLDGLPRNCPKDWVELITSKLGQPFKAMRMVEIGAPDRGKKQAVFYTVYIKQRDLSEEKKKMLEALVNSHQLSIDRLPTITVRLDLPECRPPQAVTVRTSHSAETLRELLQSLGLEACKTSAHGASRVRLLFHTVAHAKRFVELCADGTHPLRQVLPAPDPCYFGALNDAWIQVKIFPAGRESTRNFWFDALAKLQIPVKGIRHDRRKDGSPIPWCSIVIRQMDLKRLQEADIRETDTRPTQLTVMESWTSTSASRKEPTRHSTQPTSDRVPSGRRADGPELANLGQVGSSRNHVQSPMDVDERSYASATRGRSREATPSTRTRGLSTASRLTEEDAPVTSDERPGKTNSVRFREATPAAESIENRLDALLRAQTALDHRLNEVEDRARQASREHQEDRADLRQMLTMMTEDRELRKGEQALRHTEEELARAERERERHDIQAAIAAHDVMLQTILAKLEDATTYRRAERSPPRTQPGESPERQERRGKPTVREQRALGNRDLRDMLPARKDPTHP